MGLYDRDYMKTPPPEPEPPNRPPLWITIVAALVVISFVLTLIL